MNHPTHLFSCTSRAAFRRPIRADDNPSMAPNNPDLSPAPRFPLGNLYATSALTRWAEKYSIDLSSYIRRHHFGDWGDLCNEDKQANEDALKRGGRLFSYYLVAGKKVYAITEANRSMTTMLFADEY